MADNLDLQCATHAKEIALTVREEKTINQTLGVLQEDGVYAFFIYTLALEGKTQYKDKARAIIDQSSKLLRKNDLISTKDVNAENVRDVIGALADKLDKLFLARDLLERLLVYARYHAKAFGGE